MASFLDNIRVSDSKGNKSWTNTLSVWGFLIGALYVVAATIVGLFMAIPEWMTGPYTEVMLVLVGAVTANMAVRNLAVHWGTRNKESMTEEEKGTLLEELGKRIKDASDDEE